MARSKMVATLYLSYSLWFDECLIVIIERHRADQDGSRVVPRSIYANPMDLAICHVLAFALKLLSDVTKKAGPIQLFPGCFVKYSQWLDIIFKCINPP